MLWSLKSYRSSDLNLNFQYADPVADLLDKRGVFRSRLFREACVYHKGNYVKDLARLGRDLSKTIIIDNSPASYSFHPSNAVRLEIEIWKKKIFKNSIFKFTLA